MIAAVLAFSFLAGCVGYVLGRDRPPAGQSADVGFLYDMTAHHAQALTLADLELVRGTEEGVQVFAREILRFQSFEVGLMRAELADWGFTADVSPQGTMAWMGEDAMQSMDGTDGTAMPGLASDDELEALEAAEGRDADALFIRLMQDHHRGGVAMAEAAVEQVDDDEVQALAGRMARNQRIEIAEMESALERLELAPDPPGWQPAA